MANVNAGLATFTLTPHKAYINNPLSSDADAGVDGRAVSEASAGIVGTANLKLDQLVGLKGKIARESEADAGIDGRALSEVDTGIDGRALSEVSVGLLSLGSATIGLVIPWSQNMPIRTTQEWEEYEAVEPLPIAYGKVPLKAVQFSKDRRQWLVSDLPIKGVTKVEIDGQQEQEFLFKVVLDTTDRLVSIIEFNEPTPFGAEIRVEVEGRLNPLSGGLIENPADMLWDILNNVVGFEVPYATFDRFRTETSNQGYRIAGVLNDPELSIAGQIEEIAGNVGAVVSPAMGQIAKLYPKPR